MTFQSFQLEPTMAKAGRIRVGIGGWSYKPWRETFYPSEVKASQELDYASRQMTAIEINSTFYRLQTPKVFAKWRDSTPDNFVFTVKAPRFITQRKVLADAKDGIARFLGSGIESLGKKLGAVLWQLAPTHTFDPDDLQAFLRHLPVKLGSARLRHALNVRHESFRDERFIDIARKHRIAVVFEDDDHFPAIPDVTADFVYARLRRSVADCATGYSKAALKTWATHAQRWAEGGYPNLSYAAPREKQSVGSRDVFIFFINGAKERAPAAALSLISLLR